MVIQWWPLFLAGLLVVAGVKLWERRQRQLAGRNYADSLVAARADYEHHMVMLGDPRGLFGQYPPVV